MDLSNILQLISQPNVGLPDIPDIGPLLPQAQAAPQPAMNVLQQAAMPQDIPAPPPPPPPPPPATESSAEKPKRRRSLLDTIGRISDVLAKVGGAEALYQPTLDAREDRELALGDHTRKVSADEIKLATDKFALSDAHNTRLGQVARGLKAIQKSGGDINRAWPELAQRMGLEPDTVASVGQALATDPTALDGLIAATTDPKYDQSKYGGSVVYGKDANGNLVAFQPSLGNEDARNILPEGVTPIDPVKFVDTGGAQVGYGSRTGSTQKILPKTEKPGGAADRASRERIARMGINSREKIAAMNPKNQPANSAPMVEAAKQNLQELRTIYTDLNKMGAMVSPNKSSGANVAARVRSSGVGQMLEGAVGTEAQTKRDRINSIRPALMQSLAKATGMTGKQLDSNADVKLFMQTVTNPAASYEANLAAIDGLERFLETNAKSAPAPAPRKAAGGWKIVGVK